MELLSFDEVVEVARKGGLELYVRELGPLYRIVCRDAATGGEGAEGQRGRVLATTSGFIVPPLGLMHCDMLQVFTKGERGEEGQRLRRGPLGLGLLLGGAVFSYGHQRGCTKAEILAINDDEYTHRRLVRYYSYFGFEPVREVGNNGLSDLPDMLVWGGAGTRMDADVQRCLARWSAAIRRGAAGGGNGTDSGA